MEGKRGRILFVEDDEIDRMVFERFAGGKNFPYDDVSAESVKDASDILEKEKL